MTVDLSTLKNIEIEDVPVISAYMRQYVCMRSAFSPVNLFIWGSQFKAQYFYVAGKLIIYNRSWNCVLLPCGSMFTPAMIKNISDTFYESGRCGKVSFVDKEYVEMHRQELEDFNIVNDRNNADYLYLAERLAGLQGKKLQKKKNQISQFLRLFAEYRISDLTSGDFDECFDLSEKWMSDHHRQHPGYVFEKTALRLAFDYFDRLGLKGKKLHINGIMIAFSLYSKLNDETAVVHFEKFDRDVKGSAQLINREMAREIAESFKYINREEDMGIEQLRQAKKSYDPLMILDSFILERKKEEPAEKGCEQVEGL